MKIVRHANEWNLVTLTRSFYLHRISHASGYRLKDTCLLIGCPERSLYLAFTRDVGIPPKVWLSAERMVVARRMLAAGIPPYQIAEKIGFCNTDNFRREFVRVHGVLPSVFQRHCTTPLDSYPPPPGQIAPDVR